jgi:hypothetical protein
MVNRIFAVCFLVSTFFASRCNEAPQPKAATTTKRDADFLSLVYTKAFAQRFQLPEQGVYALDPGLQALAIRVVVEPGWGMLCYLDAYLDDSVAFAYPKGTAGRDIDSTEAGAMFFAQNLNAADERSRSDRWDRSATLVRSVDYSIKGQKGALSGGPIIAYERDILPNLNFITLEVVCFALNPDSAPYKLWLARVGAKLPLGIYPTDDKAYSFSIPDALLRHAGPATQAPWKPDPLSSNPLIGGMVPRPYSLPPRGSK